MFEEELRTLIAKHIDTEGRDKISEALERAAGSLPTQQAEKQPAE